MTASVSPTTAEELRGAGVTVYATVIGSPGRSTRNADLVELLSWGLSRFRVVPVISADRVYARAETAFGGDQVELVAPRSLRRAMLVGRPLVERVVAPAGVVLPVRKGDELGEVRVYDGRKLIARSPLVASRSMAKPSSFDRARWYVRQTARNMWGWVK